MWHLILHWLGVDSASGPAYLAYSGFGGDIAEITVIAAVATMYKRHSCHQRWCWRFAHYDLTSADGAITYRLCRHHHPAHPGRRQLTRNHIAGIDSRNRARTPDPDATGPASERIYNHDRDGL